MERSCERPAHHRMAKRRPRDSAFHPKAEEGHDGAGGHHDRVRFRRGPDCEVGLLVRTPTPEGEAFRWWRETLAGLNPPIHEDEPHCGYFKTRRAYRGPFYPASIFLIGETDPETGELTSDERFACEINGRRFDAYEQWQWLAKHPVPLKTYHELQQMMREFA